MTLLLKENIFPVVDCSLNRWVKTDFWRATEKRMNKAFKENSTTFTGKHRAWSYLEVFIFPGPQSRCVGSLQSPVIPENILPFLRKTSYRTEESCVNWSSKVLKRDDPSKHWVLFYCHKVSFYKPQSEQ